METPPLSEATRAAEHAARVATERALTVMHVTFGAQRLKLDAAGALWRLMTRRRAEMHAAQAQRRACWMAEGRCGRCGAAPPGGEGPCQGRAHHMAA